MSYAVADTERLMNTADTKTDEEILAPAEEAIDDVLAKYKALVDSSDDLADVLSCNNEWVLGRVFPKLASERRDLGKVRGRFERERDFFLSHLRKAMEEAEAEQARTKLLARLNLTSEELELLKSC